MSDDALEVAEAVAETSANTEESAPEVEAPAWSYAEGVSGDGDAPEWFKSDKYKSVSEQAKAYTELESKFGSFTGAPDEYDFKVSDELSEKGIDIGDDTPVMEEAKKFAKEAGMSQDGFTKMVELYAMGLLADSEALNQAKIDEISSLGPKSQERLGNLEKWGKANLSEDQYLGFEGMIQTAGSVQALERLISMTRSAPVSPDPVNNYAQTTSEQVRNMQFEKDEYGNRKVQTDPEFKARYERLKGEVWGSQAHNIVIG